MKSWKRHKKCSWAVISSLNNFWTFMVELSNLSHRSSWNQSCYPIFRQKSKICFIPCWVSFVVLVCFVVFWSGDKTDMLIIPSSPCFLPMDHVPQNHQKSSMIWARTTIFMLSNMTAFHPNFYAISRTKWTNELHLSNLPSQNDPNQTKESLLQNLYRNMISG